MQKTNLLETMTLLPVFMILPFIHYTPVPGLPGFLSLSILILFIAVSSVVYNRFLFTGFSVEPLSREDNFLLIFALFHLLVLPFSLDVNVSLRVCFELFISLGFYFCFAKSNSVVFAMQWLRGIPIAVLLASMFAIIQFITDSSWPMQGFLNETTETERMAFGDDATAKAIGPFLHGNSLAIFLTITMPLVLGMMLKEQFLPRRIFLALVFIAGILATLSNMSRGGGLSLFFAFFVMWWVSRKRWNRASIEKKGRKYIIISIIGISITAHSLGITSMAYDRFFSGAFSTRDSSSNLSRVVNLMAGVQVLSSRPIVGIGPGTSGKHFVDFGGWTGLGPHNLYLFLACERGIPTLLVFLGAVFLIMKKSSLFLRNNQNWLVLGVFAATFGVLLNGLFESVLTDIFSPFIFANLGILSYVIKNRISF